MSIRVFRYDHRVDTDAWNVPVEITNLSDVGELPELDGRDRQVIFVHPFDEPEWETWKSVGSESRQIVRISREPENWKYTGNFHACGYPVDYLHAHDRVKLFFDRIKELNSTGSDALPDFRLLQREPYPPHVLTLYVLLKAREAGIDLPTALFENGQPLLAGDFWTRVERESDQNWEIARDWQGFASWLGGQGPDRTLKKIEEHFRGVNHSGETG